MMIRVVLTVLPIITAGLYLIGLAFYQGFLEGFGIEETLFPLSVDRTLFHGFVAFLTLGAKPILYSLLAVMVLLASAVIVAVLSSSESVRELAAQCLNWLKPKIKSKSNIPTWAIKLIDATTNMFVYIAIIFLLYLGLLIVALFATQSGKEQSIQFIKNANASKNGYVTLHVENNTEEIIGKPIICGPLYCAYWVSSEVLLLQNDSVSKILAHKLSFNQEALKHQPTSYIKQKKRMGISFSNVVSIISALVALVSVFFASRAVKASKHQNEISLHAERLIVYKGVSAFASKLAAKGRSIQESEVWKFHEWVQLSEFYFNTTIYKQLDKAFSNALTMLGKIDDWKLAKENGNSNVDSISNEITKICRELRDECFFISDTMKENLRLTKD